jgi:hypothetical protein
MAKFGVEGNGAGETPHEKVYLAYFGMGALTSDDPP